jgi:surface carbohydrate biosynthesis protein (TIGR04326 family)
LRILGEYGFNNDELIPVEALRYIRGEQTAGHASAAKESATSATRVLALGEYDPSLAAVQVEFLNELVEARGPLLKVTYRPHPGVVHESSSLDSRIELSRASSISADLAKSDVAFCGSTSSASLDALMSGVPVIVFKVGGVLDGQLLPEESVSATVTCSDELLDAVDALHLTRISEIRSLSEVFYLDAGLPRWATAVLA